MDSQTAEILCNLTSDFYRREAASFSQTRNHPWPGWRQCVQVMGGGDEPGARRLRVLDVGCGNLRFERFLVETMPHVSWDFVAVDQCESLVFEDASESCAVSEAHEAFGVLGVREACEAHGARGASTTSGVEVAYRHADVMADLLQGSALACVVDEEPFDWVVAFGFMHHIPGRENRREFLASMLECVRPGGFVAVSFWRFMAEGKLASKAMEATRRALSTAAATLALEENDYLLGWRDSEDVFRYCHHFSEDEISSLADDIAATAAVVSRFQADGRTADLNSYLVFRKS